MSDSTITMLCDQYLAALSESSAARENAARFNARATSCDERAVQIADSITALGGEIPVLASEWSPPPVDDDADTITTTTEGTP